MFLGDVHGNKREARSALENARDHSVQHIVWCGDCGLWPGLGGIDFLDETNALARKYDIFNYWVGGNHENWDEWIRVVRSAPKGGTGFSYLRSHILLAPRLHRWHWDGKTFGSAAGAVSIDKAWRTEGQSWWPQETLTEPEVEGAISMFGPKDIDYMITHDCSNYTPWKSRIKPDPDSMMHRQKIDRILAAATPKMHFHGHMHQRYEWENTISNPNYLINTIGLECDGDKYNWGILDTATDEFKFRGTELADFKKDIQYRDQ